MNPLFAALVLTATTHFNIGAQVVRSTSLSVEQAHHGASTAVQIAGLGDDKRAAILVEASRGVEVRFVAGGSFETRGSGVVRVTLFADGAPPSGADRAAVPASPERVGRRMTAELLQDVRALPADRL